MNLRNISDQVMAEFERGRSREEVFHSLQSKYPGQDGKIAYCIASTPDGQLRTRYLKHNALLCLLLISYAVLTVLAELPIEFDQPIPLGTVTLETWSARDRGQVRYFMRNQEYRWFIQFAPDTGQPLP